MAHDVDQHRPQRLPGQYLLLAERGFPGLRHLPSTSELRRRRSLRRPLRSGQLLQRSAFEVPTDRTQPFGNLGRNVARSSEYWQADLGIFKEFPLPREGSRLEFRSEFFNVLNRTNFLAPNSTTTSSSFGRITGTFPARQIQFALKLYFWP